LLIAGCGSTDATSKTSSGTSKDAESSLVGKYEGKIEVAKGEEDVAGKLAEGFSSLLSMNLEIHPDNKFTLTTFGMPITGSMTVSGKSVTFTPEKIMGKTPAEFEKEVASKQPNGTKPDMTPLKGTIEADGRIVVTDETQKDGGNMVFTKAPPKVVGASTVSAEEQKLVGEYKAKVDASKLKEEDKPMAAMFDSMSLTLDADNTFVMNMMMDIKGKWSLKGDVLTLKANEKDGFTSTSGGDPQMKVGSDGSLTPLDQGKDAPPFTFVKR
jgi:hypothetical protein